jgi:hypothetical protein
MNLRVRSVTAGDAFVSAMLGAVDFAGAGSRGRLEAAAGKQD